MPALGARRATFMGPASANLHTSGNHNGSADPAADALRPEHLDRNRTLLYGSVQIA
jgi:hypothetical protein